MARAGMTARWYFAQTKFPRTIAGFPQHPRAEERDHALRALHPLLPARGTGWNFTHGKRQKILKGQNNQGVSAHARGLAEPRRAQAGPVGRSQKPP